MPLDTSTVVDIRQIQLAFARLGTMATDKAIPRVAAAALLSSTEQAFESQKNPEDGQHWAEWSDPYLEWRKEKGKVPGKILQLDGDLAASVTTDYGPDYAVIGSPKVYAALHQWGGLPDMPPGPAAVPARPYMGLDKPGEAEIFDAIEKRASGATGP